MTTQNHTDAARSHEAAAMCHRTAAEHQAKGEHAACHEHSIETHAHSEAALKASAEAHCHGA